MRVNEICDILGKNSTKCEGGSMMEKKELTKLKKEYEELTKYYKLQANLKISEESRGTSLKLAKRYEELNKIISREIPTKPHVEERKIGIFYTCPVCSEQFVAEG